MTAAEALEHPWLRANAEAPAAAGMEAGAAVGVGQLSPSICASLHAFKVRFLFLPHASCSSPASFLSSRHVVGTVREGKCDYNGFCGNGLTTL